MQLEILAKIVAEWRPRPRRVLDVGCGDGILGRMLMEAYPEAQACFVDFSEPMLEAARRKVGQDTRATLIRADFGSRQWLEAVAPHAPFDVVVSGFSIHHQPDERKQALYAEIYGLLEAGGVFLNLEHVAPATPAVSALFDSYFIDHLLRFHQAADPAAARESIAQTYYGRPDKTENILAPLDEQCGWLRQIGFEDVDCFFRAFELALFGGRKLANEQA
jgi:ubiquinone/menaquinone biosynthesis C-methylase UbiE